jgi:hypothetical protein
MKKAPPNLQLSSAALCMPAPKLIDMGLSSGWVREHYPLLCSSFGIRWPPLYKDFARELARLLPRKRAIDAQATAARGIHTHAIGCLVRRARWWRSRKRSASERDGGGHRQRRLIRLRARARKSPSNCCQQPGFLQDTSVQTLRQREADGTTLPLDDGAATGLRPG